MLLCGVVVQAVMRVLRLALECGYFGLPSFSLQFFIHAFPSHTHIHMHRGQDST